MCFPCHASPVQASSQGRNSASCEPAAVEAASTGPECLEDNEAGGKDQDERAGAGAAAKTSRDGKEPRRKRAGVAADELQDKQGSFADRQGPFADKEGSSADKEGPLTDKEGSFADGLKDMEGSFARAGPGEDSASKMEPAVLPAVMPSRQTMFAQLR